MLIRQNFEKGGVATNQILDKYAPKNIATITDIPYRQDDPDALLDIYYTPKNAETAPTIVWVHGGGWLAGNKDDLRPWAQILAGKGVNVIAINYSLAPEHHYPLPTVQMNAALGFLSEKANYYRLNLDKIVLGGDSAGAQIIAQASLIETNEAYAKGVDITPKFRGHKLAGLLLNCGPYDLRGIDFNSNSDGARLVRAFLWGYTGDKKFYEMKGVEYFSIPPYVTKDFPPSFITVGNIDPLHPHSKKLAEALQKAGVFTDTLFYPANYTPQLNHEYQFNLDTEEGMNALDRMIEFTFARTGAR